MQARQRNQKFSARDAIFGMGGVIVFFIMIILMISISFIDSVSASYASKQMQWIVVAFFVSLIAMYFDYRWLVRNSWLLYGLGIFLLFATAGMGEMRNGSRRWIKLGPILFQTSDFMKIATILLLARILSQNSNKEKLMSLFLPFGVVALPCSLILLQPDMGTSLVFVPILFAMIFIAGANTKHLKTIIIMALLLLPIVYSYGLKDYQQKRVKMFLFQNTMTQKERQAEGYHLTQSMIAHGSGGFAGKGLGEGTQNRHGFLPERHTDFIFAVVGEEWGFIGTTVLLLLYLFLFSAMLMAAYSVSCSSGQLIIVGVVALMVMQTLVNTSMTVGMAPITGLPLPFMSYGGTSLLFCCCCVGIILSILGHEGSSYS